MRGDVRIYATTDYEPFDFETPRGSRCVGLRFDGLELAVGLDGGDAEKVAALGALIDALDKLRDAAMARIREAAREAGDTSSEGWDVVGGFQPGDPLPDVPLAASGTAA